ncbi:MAG: hypothetical protein JNM78_00330 [Cyclobacteriaceae bacterium]|nr:hypothetical protein [Cyclobacteriaceae bacterium]
MKRIIFILFISVGVAKGQQLIHEERSSQIQVAIFMAVDCPITQKYLNTIKEVANQYAGKSVQFVGYFPVGLSKKESMAFRDEYKIPKSIELIDDKKHEWTEMLNAKVTPEVFVIKNKQVLYRGAIDNWFYELGRYRKKVTAHYLVDAIQASLNNEKPSITETEALGCFIQRSERTESHPHH